VQLAHQFQTSDGQSYVTTIEQTMAVQMGEHAMDGSRELSGGYTIRASETSNGADLQGVVRLDSARATLVMGPGQQRADTRHLPGREFSLALPRAGGVPVYGDEMPSIEMGERGGGAVPVSVLIDYGFPRLPDEPASVGSSWTEQRTRRQLESTMWVTAEITTTYTVVGHDTVQGSRCLLIESESSGTLSKGFAHGTSMDYVGELRGSATWCFDAAAGTLVHMSGQETTDGRVESQQASASIAQTTSITIQHVNGTGGG
jgi:hypothetical protein